MTQPWPYELAAARHDHRRSGSTSLATARYVKLLEARVDELLRLESDGVCTSMRRLCPDDAPVCAHPVGAYICTRARGHAPPHVACGSDAHNLARS